MASFNGVDLGPFVTMPGPVNQPVEYQVNRYPGVNGVQMVRMGARGGETTAYGACVGADPASLSAVEQQFRDLEYGSVLGVLVDTLGNSWANVVLVSFRPQGEVLPMTDDVGFARKYAMTFFHLSM